MMCDVNEPDIARRVAARVEVCCFESCGSIDPGRRPTVGLLVSPDLRLATDDDDGTLVDDDVVCWSCLLPDRYRRLRNASDSLAGLTLH